MPKIVATRRHYEEDLEHATIFHNPQNQDIGGGGGGGGGCCRRLLHTLNPPHSAFLLQQFLARCHPYILLRFLHLYTIQSRLSLHKKVKQVLKIIKNEVGCRDDTVPKIIATRRHCKENLEHATIFRNPLKPRCREGVAEDCCML